MADVFSRTEDEPEKLPSSCSLESRSMSVGVHSSPSPSFPLPLSCSAGLGGATVFGVRGAWSVGV